MPQRASSLVRLSLTASLTGVLALVATASASAATTIGQLAPGTSPPAACTGSPFDLIQPTVTSGNSYVVPAGGAAVTSWSTNAAAGADQMLTMKVFRKIADPAIYRVVGHDGPRPLTPSTVNTFQVNIPVQAGDLVGLQNVNASPGTPNACDFNVPGESEHFGPGLNGGDLPDGAAGDFSNVTPDSRLNVSAVVAGKASNDFSLAKIKKNKNKGTATIAVDVPGPGTLSLTGNGVKTQRVGGARISKDVSQAGTYKLKVKAKGAKKTKLHSRGKVKVKVKVTFKPAATGGDLAGDPNTERKKIKLIDNG